MRSVDKLQVLTTGRVDVNGNQISPDVIDWTDYLKNPVLLYAKREEGHYGEVVGKVEDIKRWQDGYVGRLSFMERVEAADIAYEKYSQGVLPFVSIGGFAIGEEKDGVFHVMKYRVREFSLVKFPANIDCTIVNASELKWSDRRMVKSETKQGMEVRYMTMSADYSELNRILNEETMKNDELEMKPCEASGDYADETVVNASEETVEASEETVEASEETIEASEETIEASEETIETSEETVEASEETIESITGTERETNASAQATPPNGMVWHERNLSVSQTKQFSMDFKELNCDADFRKRMDVLSSAIRSGSPKTDALPENAETVQILASAMLADEKMVILASRVNYTDDATRIRRNALEVLVDCAAGNAANATLAAADLGVINWLSMFYQQMFANDTFRRSLRFVPMSDREGAIYIEDGISAPTYVGNNTPINAPIYTYEDIKRTIARRVFAFTPILFQHSELAILAYDKQSWGIKTTMAQMAQDFSTYILQVIANTAGISQVPTSGLTLPGAAAATASTAGMFPIEAPNSALTVLKPTRNDLIALQGRFLMQQYNLNQSKIEMVLPANMYTWLAEDPAFYNKLTRQNSGENESNIDFQAVRVTPRNPVARYNTASSAAELDPAMYVDNLTNDDGTFTAVTPATTTAQHVGAGIAFVENEVIAGVGAVELIVKREPRNYGTEISGWFSGGATVARQNGVGAALIVPTVQA